MVKLPGRSEGCLELSERTEVICPALPLRATCFPRQPLSSIRPQHCSWHTLAFMFHPWDETYLSIHSPILRSNHSSISLSSHTYIHSNSPIQPLSIHPSSIHQTIHLSITIYPSSLHPSIHPSHIHPYIHAALHLPYFYPSIQLQPTQQSIFHPFPSFLTTFFPINHLSIHPFIKYWLRIYLCTQTMLCAVDKESDQNEGKDRAKEAPDPNLNLGELD